MQFAVDLEVMLGWLAGVDGPEDGSFGMKGRFLALSADDRLPSRGQRPSSLWMALDVPGPSARRTPISNALGPVSVMWVSRVDPLQISRIRRWRKALPIPRVRENGSPTGRNDPVCAKALVWSGMSWWSCAPKQAARLGVHADRLACVNPLSCCLRQGDVPRDWPRS